MSDHDNSTHALLTAQFSDMKEQIRAGHAVINRELRDLGTKTEHIGLQIVRMQTKAEALQETVDKHDASLYDEKDGHVITIDRLSQAEGNRKKHFGIVWTALIALAVERITSYFTKGGA